MRPDWHEYFLSIAKIISTRSTCNSRPTGAVIVLDNQIISTGYNASIPNAPHCTDQVNEDGTPYCHSRWAKASEHDKYDYCRSSHAEANAIAQAARLGIPLEGSTLYVTLAPCYTCTKLLAVSRIKHVYYELAYGSTDPKRDEHWQNVLKDAQIETFEQLTISDKTINRLMSALTNVTSARRLPDRNKLNAMKSEPPFDNVEIADYKEILENLIKENIVDGRYSAPAELKVSPPNIQIMPEARKGKATAWLKSIGVVESLNIHTSTAVFKIVNAIMSDRSKEYTISFNAAIFNFIICDKNVLLKVTVNQLDAVNELRVLVDACGILLHEVYMELIDRFDVTLLEGDTGISIENLFVETSDVDRVRTLLK